MDKNIKDDIAAEILDRIVNNESFLKRMPDNELIKIAKSLEDYDEASNALTLLSIMGNKAVIPLCRKILLENLGDQFLQAISINLLYESNCEEAVEIIRSNIEQVSASVLGAIMDNLSVDSLQQFGKTISPEIIQSVQKRYKELSDSERERISDNYEWFKKSYSDKIMG